MDMEEVAEIIEFLPEVYRDSLKLRLLHGATIDGKADLVARIAALAPEMVEHDSADETAAPETETGIREDFYAKISQVTSENVREVAKELRAFDAESLTDGERNLLRAVLAVADAVTAPGAAFSETEPVVRKPMPARASCMRHRKNRSNLC
jgi:hypothetical protein